MEGIHAGRYWITLQIDPDGTAEDSGGDDTVDQCAGFLLHDSVPVTVQQPVTVAAIDAWGAESATGLPADEATFLFSRAVADSAVGLTVYYRIHTAATGAVADDPVANASRRDYQVRDRDGPVPGLADDPVTGIGSISFAPGVAETTLTLTPIDDSLVEWDEQVTIQLIAWDEYRALHDQLDGATPNDGLPASYNGWVGWQARSPYSLTTDEAGNPVQHTATITLLDNDAAVSNSYQQPDYDGTQLAVETITYDDALHVDLVAAHAQYVLPGVAPQYREDDNLHPIAEALLRLPPGAAGAESLSAVYTVGGISGPRLDFDVTELARYLQPQDSQTLRLVVPGPDALAEQLATGHYDHDLQFQVVVDGTTYTRTLRGSTDLVNRVDAVVGSPEWGDRWTLPELDRLVPGDGMHSGSDQASSRLTSQGAVSQAGVALVRGDNSVSWFAVSDIEPAQVIELDDADVRLTPAHHWVGEIGRDGSPYRTSTAGLREAAEEVSWTFSALTPGSLVQILAHWEAGPTLASNAAYLVDAQPLPGASTAVLVDQRFAAQRDIPGDNRAWHSLGFFVVPPQQTQLQVRLSSQIAEGQYADGLLAAGALMLVDHWEFDTPADTYSQLHWAEGAETTPRVVTTHQDVYRFDPATGMLTEREDRNHNKTQYRYVDADDDGRLDEVEQIVAQGGLNMAVQYEAGQVASITDWAGRTTDWLIQDGRVVQALLPDPGLGMAQPVYEFEYSEAGGLLQRVQDPLGHDTQIERDPDSSQVIAVVNADGHDWQVHSYLADGLDGSLHVAGRGNCPAPPDDASGSATAACLQPWAEWIDTLGSVWRYQVDARGLVTAAAKPPSDDATDVWLWRRNQAGQVTSFIQPAGGGGDTPLPQIVTQQQYDDHGNMVLRQFADGSFETWEYDERFNQVIAHRDPLGRQSYYSLDWYGNVAYVRQFEQSYDDTPDRFTLFRYTAAPEEVDELPGGLVNSTTVAAYSAQAVTTLVEYYEAGPEIGLPARRIEAAGTAEALIAVQYSYDVHRQLVEQTDANGQRTQFVYDDLGRLWQRVLPATGAHGAAVTRYAYDATGNATEVVDAGGASTMRQYDAMGRLVTETLPVPGGAEQSDQRAAVTRYDYDGEGNVLLQTDAAGYTTTYTYDSRNQLVAVARPEPGPRYYPGSAPEVNAAPVTTYSYDTWGNLAVERDPLGAASYYQYDMFQQVTRITLPEPGTGQHDSPVTLYQYDAAGQLVETSVRGQDGWRVTSFAYDDLGRLRAEARPANAQGERLAIRYAYDSRDNLVEVVQGDGRVTRYSYDLHNRGVSVQLPDPDQDGPLGPPTTLYQYNVDGTLRQQTNLDPLDPGSAVSTSYVYDNLGHVIREHSSDPDGVGPVVGATVLYEYDVFGNCVQQTELLSDVDAVTQRYEYDRLQRLWRTETLAGGARLGESVRVYDILGQQTQLRELVVDQVGGGQYRVTAYQYDPLGQLIAQVGPAVGTDGAPVATYYVYDAGGNVRYERNANGVWTEHQYDALGREVTLIESATDDHVAPVTRYEYAVTGERTASIDPLGRRTEWGYDDVGQMRFEQLVSSGQVLARTQSTYDLFGNVIAVSDLDGNQLMVAYDALDRPVTISDNGAVSRRSYNAQGQLASATDAAGATVSYRYDLLGRQTIVMPPHPEGRAATQIWLDEADASTTGTWQLKPDGWGGNHLAATVEDDAPRAFWQLTDLQPGVAYEVLATWVPDPDNVDQAVFRLRTGQAELIDPVAVDQRVIVSDVVDGTQTWQRLATVTATGSSMEIALESNSDTGVLIADGLWFVELSGNSYANYDARGNVIARSDALGNTEYFAYNALSLPISHTDERGETTQYRYDALGRLQAVLDPLGNETRYEYDDADRVVAEWVYCDGQPYVTRFQYDALGNLIQVIDRLGQVHAVRLDALGRVMDEAAYTSLAAAELDQAEYRAHRVYDAVGRLTAVEDEAASYQFTWDELDRVVTSMLDVSGAPPVLLHNEFTRSDSQRATLFVDVQGQRDHQTAYEYDGHGRLARVQQSGPEVQTKTVQFQYDVTGRLEAWQRHLGCLESGDSLDTHLEFDGMGRLVSLVHGSGSDVLAQYEWVFDVTNQIVLQRSADGETRLHYDSAGQLVEADYDFRDDEQFAYDANGNPADSLTELGTRNLLESDGTYRYSYDAQGRRVRREEIETGRITCYRWDAMGRLVEIEERASDGGAVIQTVQYRYDVWGRRVGKSVAPATGPAQSETYVYDGQDILLRFESGAVSNRYLHGPLVDQVLADEQVDGAGESARTLWPLTDHLGSVRDLALFDAEHVTPSVVNHITYDAFGAVAEQSAASVDHLFGFTGREIDAESDLNYYRARYYDPVVGQFISEDPAGFQAGDVNLRRYVENDPVNRIDPSGMYGDDVHFYFNYFAARYVGLDQPSGWVTPQGRPLSEALVIAYFATRVDYDGNTRPVGNGVQGRARFHFPDPGTFGATVKRGDVCVRTALRAVGNTGDVEMFGVLLHVYQDSFAHEGRNMSLGHATSAKPDQPYLHPVRDAQMARRVYDEMVNLLLARRGVTAGSPAARRLLQGKSFNAFWSEVNSVFLQAPPNVKGVSAKRNRILCWEQLIEKDFPGAQPQFNDRNPKATNEMAKRFRTIATFVPAWYLDNYSHHRLWGNWRPFPGHAAAPWQTWIPDPPQTTKPSIINPGWYPPYGSKKW